MNESRAIVIRGSRIFEDINGHICLDDLWRAAKASESKAPAKWRLGRMAQSLIVELEKKIKISSLKENKPVFPSIYSRRGRGSTGTFAHPILAAAYAGYLSPKLELEVREIWLRYRAGDATLADEILQRATAEENRWAGARALSRGQRVSYTDTLKQHYVTGRGYMECTEAVYLKLLGGKSFQLRQARGLAPKEIRDAISLYAGFLATTAKSSDELARHFDDDKSRDEAFRNARLFGDRMFDMLTRIDMDQSRIRYLVI